MAYLKNKTIKGRTVDQSKLPTKKDVKHLAKHEHYRQYPELCIGSIDKEKRNVRIFSLTSKIFKYVDTDMPKGLEKIFGEIIENASDNAFYSQNTGVHPGEIEVFLGKESAYVKSSGIPLSIFETKNKKGEVSWSASELFGVLNTSTNYTDSKSAQAHKREMQGGTFGIGSKATNIFSNFFTVEVQDPINHKYFIQTWRGFKNPEEPKVVDYEGEEPLVKVSFQPDYKYLNMKKMEHSYKEIIASRVADAAFLTKVPCHFYWSEEENEVTDNSNYYKFYYPDIESYANSYFPEGLSNHLTLYDLPSEFKSRLSNIKKVKESIAKFEYIVNVEAIIFDHPTEIKLSFANGLFTSEGGKHVETLLKSITTPLLEYLNDGISKKKTVKDNKKVILTHNEVKTNISYILSVRVSGPKWKDATKSFLQNTMGKININLEEQQVKMLKDWKLYELFKRLKEEKKRKINNYETEKTDISSKVIQNANLAGTKESYKCSLFITEGNSGANYPYIIISCVDKGKDTMGILPIRGKIINVLRAKEFKLENNYIWKLIKKAVGLKEELDYYDDENFATLNYGEIVIFADGDEDGTHIIGLIISMFYFKFKSLIDRGFLKFWLTPMIRITHRNKKYIFYSYEEKDNWVKKNNVTLKPEDIKFCKGLGSCSPEEVREDYENKRIIMLSPDYHSDSYLRVAFDKNSEYRKDMILNAQLKSIPQKQDYIYISNFIKDVFPIHPIENMLRNIPDWTGLKDVQKKILFTAIKYWSKQKQKNIKVIQLAGSASQKTGYRHGEQSMCESIFNMATDYIGSNNIPYFNRDGLFGSRNMCGKDHADPRYPYLAKSDFWDFLFPKEDEELLVKIEQEGEKREPKRFLPVIPCIFNPIQAIGTGWSTTCFPVNPEDLIDWIISKNNGKKPRYEEIPPFYRYWAGEGYDHKTKHYSYMNRGEIKLVEHKEKISLAKTESESEDEFLEEEEISDEETIDSVCSEPKNIKKELVKSSLNDFVFNKEKEGIKLSIYDIKEKEMELKMEYGLNQGKNNDKYVYKIIGHYKWSSENGYIEIDDIPPGISYVNYKELLELMKKKGMISGIVDYSTDKKPHFKFKILSDKLLPPNADKLHITKTVSSGNIVVLDDNDKPVKFNCVGDYMEFFYKNRLPFYQKRKDLLLKKIEDEIFKLEELLRLLKSLLFDGNLDIKNKPESEIHEFLDSISVRYHIFNDLPHKYYKKEKYEELLKKRDEKLKDKDFILSRNIQTMWNEDLEKLLIKLREVYGISKTMIS